MAFTTIGVVGDYHFFFLNLLRLTAELRRAVYRVAFSSLFGSCLATVDFFFLYACGEAFASMSLALAEEE
jgi:hypothetical protein